MKEEGTWIDVAVLHEPEGKRRKAGKGTRFEAGVGLAGYERGTGDEVIREPSLKGPADKKPVARDLFEE